MPKTPDQKKFNESLRERRESQELTQEELADLINKSTATVSRWEKGTTEPNASDLLLLCQALGCSADYLLCLETSSKKTNKPSEQEDNGWKWIEHVSDEISAEVKKQIEKGISVFYWFIGKMEADQLFQENSENELITAFKNALLTGALQLIDIPTVDPQKEKTLKDRFPLLKAVHVTRVPGAPISHYGVYRVIATECVAAFTARQVLPRYCGLPIAIGGGYSMLRVAENAPQFELDKFKGTKWIPTMTARYHYEGRSFLRSENYVAAVLASRLPGSECMFLPFIPLNDRKKIRNTVGRNLRVDEKHAADAYVEFERARVAFISIGNIDKEAVNPEDGLSSTDGESTSDARRSYYRFMKARGEDHRFAGEVSSLMLDNEGRVIDDETNAIADEVFALDLEIFRKIAKNDIVWIVTAGSHKCDAIKMAIRTGLASGLIIDEHTADALLDDKPKTVSAP